MEVRYIDGEAYEVMIRGHRVVVDQPVESGGTDTAPTPTELFAASLASCVAFYAGRYLTRHGYGRDGLTVSASFDMATDRPARVTSILLDVKAPAELPDSRLPAFKAVIEHCTVHNTLHNPPAVTINVV